MAERYWTEMVGRPMVRWGGQWMPGGTGRRPPHHLRKVSSMVGSWVLWGGYRRLRSNPTLYLRGVVERSCQRLAARWYPEPSNDWEDCDACGITQDICIYHRGIDSCAAYVHRRVSPDLAATLFPEE